MEVRDILRDYDLGEPLAEGGQGLLRKARRKSDGIDVVIKKYSQMADSKNWDSYEEGEVGASREIAFLKRANQDRVKGVPYLIEYGVTGGWQEPVAIFEHIPGKTLEETVSDPSYNPSVDRIREIFELLKEPINYAHNNGVRPVVHRDINPRNIMVNGNSVVLMDWATATPTSGKTYHSKTNIATLYYTAPEVLAGKPIDGRADIYSLGRVLQLLFLGKDLFEASDGQPTSRDFENINVPKRVIEVLKKATQENPEHRYRNIKEFYEAFINSLEVKPVIDKPVIEEPDSHSKINSDTFDKKIALKAKAIYNPTAENKTSFLLNVAREVGGSQGAVVTLGNVAREVGGSQEAGVTLGNVAREVGGDQFAVVTLGNVAREVGGSQEAGVTLGNVAREVGGSQEAGVTLGNVAREVGGDQFAVVTLGNVAREVGGSQEAGVTLGNVAREVGGDQFALFSGLNFAREVGRDQFALFSGLNVAREVGGTQGAIIFSGLNVAREVGGTQGAIIFSGLNVAREVGRDQGAIIFSGLNVAREVGWTQGAIIFSGLNVAREVGGNQGAVVTLGNVAREVGGDQFFGLINLALESIGKKRSNSLEDRISKQIGIFCYAKSGNVNQYGLLTLRGSGPWYSRISLFYGKLRED